MGIRDRTWLRNATVLVGSSVSVLPLAALAPALPTLALAFQGTPNADLLVRLTLTMPALLIAVGAPFAGLLIDRWGRKPVIILSLIGFGLAGTAAFLLNSLVAILVSRAVVGLAAAGLISGFSTLVADYFTGRRLNLFMGYQGASIGAGAMVGTLLGGFLADVGWQFPFLTHLYAFLVLPAVVVAIHEPGRGVGGPSAEEEGFAPRERLAEGTSPPEHPAICCVEQAHPAIARAITEQQELEKVGAEVEGPARGSGLPRRTLTWVYAIAFAAVVAFNVFPVQLPFYLTALTTATNAQIALALALQMLTSVVVALRYQRIQARLSHRSISALVFVTIGVGHLIVAATPAYSLVILGSMIAGAGLGLLAPNLGAVVARSVPPQVRGRAMGGLAAAIFLGQFFSPLVLQPVLQVAGIVATFWVAGVGALAAAIVLLAWRLRPVLGREEAANLAQQERGA